MRTELVDAHELLRQSLENCAEFLRDAGLIARLDLSATNSRIAADPGRLQQVFWNLIINAARYSPARSHLTIRTRNIAADALAIEFQDEGRGLEASQLEEIFEPFIQARAGGAERGPGLGLGLSIGRWIVEAHGGTLVAESPGPGRGATFRVVLRTADPTEVATIDRRGREARPWRSPPRGARGSPQIPQAHDDPPGRGQSGFPAALAMSLSLLGYEVRPANSLRTALAAAENEGYDLIVSDLELGDGTGLELLSSLGPGVRSRRSPSRVTGPRKTGRCAWRRASRCTSSSRSRRGNSTRRFAVSCKNNRSIHNAKTPRHPEEVVPAGSSQLCPYMGLR